MMRRQRTRVAACVALVAMAGSAAHAAPVEPGAAIPIEVRGGTATFDTGTSIPAITVHGRSGALRAKARVSDGAEGITLEQLDATLPVESLETGMGLRDEHMRRYIFTAADGKMPDLRFHADKATCTPTGSGQATCQLSGAMAIRGAERPFAMALKVNRTGESFRAAGDTTLKLSTWGIERPSQFGVSTDDEVKLHLEFVAQPSVRTTAENRGQR